MFSNCDVEKSKNKVYINPNFNRPPVNNNPMHVNPRFPHLLSSIPPNLNSTNKIHINPNFMKSSSANVVGKAGRTSTNISFMPHKSVSSHLKSFHSHEQSKIEKQILATPAAKSRYSLVRQNVHMATVDPGLEKPKTTVQINKYKSVPLNDIKRKLDNAKNALSKQRNLPSQSHLQNESLSTNKNYTVASTTTKRNKFKLVNNKAPARNVKIKTRIVIDKNKKVNQLRLNRAKGNLKKNNIPCPTFRKFGKCLRKEHGNCDFLHDKKHVSVCRKFIKGLCHDKDCLLSHDLTMKKMPTCYFYLKGTCTKPDCPYLHVKLNDKVKVCTDFLKGYCEKGSKCLQRHFNKNSEQKVKGSLQTRTLTSQNSSKLKVRKSESINVTTSIANKTLADKNNLDRYYQENKESSSATEICEVIKPMRCKLGSLPSFIQL